MNPSNDTSDAEFAKVRAMLTELAAAEPDAEFVDRVMGKVAKVDRRRVRQRRVVAVAVGAVFAAAVGLVWLRMPGAVDLVAQNGKLAPIERATANLGTRAVAVVEPKSQVTWQVEPDGATRVVQQTGNVFYRVSTGSDFRVATPVGEVVVLGTCFRVEVIPMKSLKNPLVTAGLGAAVASALVVTVYEGRAAVQTKAGSVEVAAGQKAVVSDGKSPRVENAMVAAAPNTEASGEVATLRQENQTLRAKLATMRALSPLSSKFGSKIENFDKEPRDPKWAPVTEGDIRARLKRHIGFDGRVECKTECCQIDFGKTGIGESEKYEVDFSLVIDGRKPNQTSSTQKGEGLGRQFIDLTYCFDRTKTGSLPDRVAERAALLQRVQPALRKCAQLAAAPFSLELVLLIGFNGAVTDVKSSADLAPNEASDCALAAVTDAAKFAPAERETTVPITIDLDPAEP